MLRQPNGATILTLMEDFDDDEERYELVAPDIIKKHKLNAIDSINQRSKILAIKEEGSMSITFGASASADDVKAWAFECCAYSEAIGRLKSVSKLWLAKSILEYAARKDMTPAEALDDMELPEMTGFSKGTLRSYTAVLARLGEDAFIDGLSDPQILAVGAFKAPVRPDYAVIFATKRRALLERAARSRTMTVKILQIKMRELQAELEMTLTTRREKGDAMIMYIKLMEIRDTYTEEDYLKHGFTKQDVMGWILEYRLTLQEKEILPYNIDTMEIPYFLTQNSAIDIEAINEDLGIDLDLTDDSVIPLDGNT